MHGHSNYVVDLIDSYSAVDAPRILSSPLTDHKIEHLYDFGLASIALRCLNSDLGEVSESSREILRTADLTARVIYGQLRTTTIEILEIARRHVIPVVLLKGISIAEDMYAKPHHRIMGDVDILVPVEKAEDLHGLLMNGGFRIQDDPQAYVPPEEHHHLPELLHADSDIAVEVHTSLFSAAPLSSEPLFQISSIWSNAEPATFHGLPCLKFRPELQLLYTVAHWAIDQKWTVNVISFNDVILILGANEQSMDWKLIASWLRASPLLAE